jgi:hypothetical protein
MQLACWRATEAHQRVFIGKPRRAYISTACDLEDLLQTAAADSLGHRVRTGIMLDTEQKLTERIWQVADFAQQLGLEHRATSFDITLPGGSEIVGLTAGGRRAAASTGFQRMRYSEASYYSDDESLTAASASVGKLGREVIETTCDIGASNGLQMRKIWDDPGNDFEVLFLPFEMHPEYRADPSLITDEEWAWAQTEGFSLRESAAYWMREILPNKCAGDVVKACHEYPQLERHMFQSSSGIWVRSTPRVLEPVNVIRVMGVTGDEHWPLLIYVEPKDTSGDIVITVDTATGIEKDRSVVCVVDCVSQRLVACFMSGGAFGDDTARVAHAAWEYYSTEDVAPTIFSGDRLPLRRPKVLIELNTVGNICSQPAQRMGLPFETFNTTADSKYLGLLAAKRAVEEGRLEGPTELREECNELIRNDQGKFTGHKDLLMMYGKASTWIAANPRMSEPKHVPQVERSILVTDMIRKYARGRR